MFDKVIMKNIKIRVADLEVKAQLNNSKTASLIWDSLPQESSVNTWGDEIYFNIPINTGLENGVDIVEIGDLGYWPDGPSFCIFFGPTPISKPGKIRPASKVNLIGKIIGEAKVFKKAKAGQTIIVEKSNEDITYGARSAT